MSVSWSRLHKVSASLLFFSLLYLSVSAQVIWQEDWQSYSLGVMDDNEPESKGWDARLGFGSGQWKIEDDGTGNKYLSRLNKANECCYWKGCRMLREEQQAYDDVYFGFRFKFDSNFDFKSGGKLNGVIGGNDPSPGVPTDGASGASVSLMWRKHPNGSDAYMHTYIYHENKDDQWGQRDTFKDASNQMIKIVRDQWYSVVVGIQMNTQNVADGRVQVWLDGVPVVDRNDFLFRSGSGTWGWDINQLIYFFGGNGPGWAPGNDSYVYEDDWVLSQSLPTNLMNGFTPPQKPTADLSISSTMGLAPLTVNFDASGSTDPDGTSLSYRWKMGDGTPVVINQNPTKTHTYTVPGQYEVRMTVIDSDGLKDVVSQLITVQDPNAPVDPVASVQVSSTGGLAPLPVTFDASGSYDPDGNIGWYRWKFGDGSPVKMVTSSTISHTYTAPGVYEARLTVIDNDGNKGSFTTTITVTSANVPVPPIAQFTPSVTSGFGPLTVNFDASGSSDPDGSITMYRWNFGDGSPVQLKTTPGITHTYTTPGLYSARLAVIDNDGKKDIFTVQITVLNSNAPQPPTASIQVPSTSGELPFTVNFDASGSSDPDGNIVLYRWNFGDGTIVQYGQTISHTFTQVGTFTTMLAVFDNDGKVHKAYVDITVTAPSTGGPCASLSSNWTYSDIGNVGLPGDVCYDNVTGEYNITASGSDIWGNQDEFGFLHRTLNGDGEMQLKINYIQNTHTYAKGGVMMREQLTTDSKHAMIVMNQNKRAMQYRKAAGTTTLPSSGSWWGPDYTHPTWVKLKREGDVFSSFISTDGSTWSLVDTVHISMSASIYMGIAMTSHNNTLYNTSTFSEVQSGQQVFTSGAEQVELISFEATALNGLTNLEWVTNSESDNAYFSIERSKDGELFEHVTHIDGGGTTSQQSSYATIDQEPWEGTTYYRLSYTDLTGVRTELHTLRFLNADAGLHTISVFPNPVSGHNFTIRTDGVPLEYTRRARVVDAKGRVIFSQEMLESELTITIPETTPPGVYHVMVDYHSGAVGETVILH